MKPWQNPQLTCASPCRRANCVVCDCEASVVQGWVQGCGFETWKIHLPLKVQRLNSYENNIDHNTSAVWGQEKMAVGCQRWVQVSEGTFCTHNSESWEINPPVSLMMPSGSGLRQKTSFNRSMTAKMIAGFLMWAVDWPTFRKIKQSEIIIIHRWLHASWTSKSDKPQMLL